jgi:prepilin-type processing-associated H-X9-DG protein/prepilin-type N-terminal cleavage/methylation domain-containing protein
MTLEPVRSLGVHGNWQEATMQSATPIAIRHPTASGFSLVELLVVLGIIAILVALLLPTLVGTRERAKELQCMATLRGIGMAAQINAADHGGYIQAAGMHWDLPDGVVSPRGLGDERATRYTYYREQGSGASYPRMLSLIPIGVEVDKRPVPWTVAMAISLGVKVRLDSRENLEEDMQKENLRKLFRCPSQPEPQAGVTQIQPGSSSWQSPLEWSSYIFNEAVLGRRGKDLPHAPMGKVTKIKRPTVVMLAMDGRPRDPIQRDYLLVFERGPEWTLLDFQQLAEDPTIDWCGREALDFLRHRYRANVLFVDGHVEAVAMTRDGLKNVGISRGIYQ